MGIFDRLFRRSRGSAQVAEQRLRFVLAYERALIAHEHTEQEALYIQPAASPPDKTCVREQAPMPMGPPEVLVPVLATAALVEPIYPPPPPLPEPDPARRYVEPMPEPAPTAASPRWTETPRDKVLTIRHSILPGQILHHNGTIMIYGDVHPAAQVISDGDVIIFGRLRGVVHAGAAGDASATIAALIFMPTQARIARHVMSSWQTNRHQAHTAELARIRNDEIVIEEWQTQTEKV